MADTNEIKNMIRKGTVQSVNAGTMKARVKFGDKGGIVSGELHILVRHRIVVPGEKEKTGWEAEAGGFLSSKPAWSTK